MAEIEVARCEGQPRIGQRWTGRVQEALAQIDCALERGQRVGGVAEQQVRLPLGQRGRGLESFRLILPTPN